MYFETYNFRNALAILKQRPEWDELIDVIRGVARDDIIAAQKEFMAPGKRTPAGAQRAVNTVFRERLSSSGWIPERRLFDGDSSTEEDSARWAMDFIKRGDAPEGSAEPDFGLGVEVAFNHAEAIVWTLLRLDLASEAPVQESARIDAGVAIYASRSFKKWGRMDSAVGTYEQACQWLKRMRPVVPIPLVLIGLNPRDDAGAEDWEAPDVFRGTRKGPQQPTT